MNISEQLTQLSAQSIQPSFNADGKCLAFTSGRGKVGGGSSVYLMDADGSNLRKMPSFGKDNFKPVFDQASGIIAYASDIVGEGLVSDSTINVIDVNGRLIRQTAHAGTDYVFSPDGCYLAYSTGVDIYIEAIWENKSVQLTDIIDPQKSAIGPSPRNGKPAFHPFKDLIAFTSSRDRPGRDEVYTMKRDGTQQTRLTFEKGATNPIFNPNGAEVYFISACFSKPSSSCICKANTDGSDVRLLVNSVGIYGDVSLSPNGSWLLYTSYPDEVQNVARLDISLMNVYTGNVYDLVSDGHYNRYACFSPDLNSIVYCSRRGGTTEIYKLNIQPLVS